MAAGAVDHADVFLTLSSGTGAGDQVRHGVHGRLVEGLAASS